MDGDWGGGQGGRVEDAREGGGRGGGGEGGGVAEVGVREREDGESVCEKEGEEERDRERR